MRELEASTGWRPAVEANYRAQVSMPAGIDETRLLVTDENGDRAAETAWRPTDNYQPRPATWD
jgi:hypothetical protein